MKIQTLEQAIKLLENELGEHQEHFFSPEDLQSKFKPKRFRFQNIFHTQKIVTSSSDRNVLLQIFNDIKEKSEDQRYNKRSFQNLIHTKQYKWWNILAKYDTLVCILQFQVSQPLGIQILPNFGFPVMVSLTFHQVLISSFQPFAWIDAPFLVEIKALDTQIARIKGLNKTNLPCLTRIFLAKNHITDFHRMSRVHLTKDTQFSNLRFLVRKDFFQTEQKQEVGDINFYDNEQVFESLKQVNSLNFIVKVEAKEIAQTCSNFLGSYMGIFLALYRLNIFMERARSQEELRRFWRKKPLVEVEYFSLFRRVDNHGSQVAIKLEEEARKRLINLCGPEQSWA